MFATPSEMKTAVAFSVLVVGLPPVLLLAAGVLLERRLAQVARGAAYLREEEGSDTHSQANNQRLAHQVVFDFFDETSTPKGITKQLRKGGVENMMENIQGAMRVLLASTIVQYCEAVDENLANWRKGLVAALRERT